MIALRRSRLHIIALAFVALITTVSAAKAEPLHIDINGSGANPMPIAVTDLIATDGSSVGQDIARVVAADLERSGLFRPIDRGAFIERITSAQTMPRFADWRQISAQALVTGSVQADGNGRLRASFRLWNVTDEQQVAGKEFNTVSNNWRRVAHLIADEIYKRLTGEEGYFDTRIVYVSESGPATKRIKRLAIMDQDSENHKFLTDGGALVLTPRFSPNMQQIIYLSYAGRTPQVHLRDLQTGRENVLGSFEGMSFAPRFNADGSKVIMSISKNGSTGIYEMDLRSRQMRQVTASGAIDTSPSYSPDGRRIVFNSDRGGSQQLYIMDASGANVQRISFGSGRYGTPVWSPRGDKIAFTKMEGGTFSIGVMNTDGKREQILSSDFMQEGPTWSPNGRVIMFTRQDRSYGGKAGKSRLYSVDITGRNLRQVITPMDSSDPAWSPLLYL